MTQVLRPAEVLARGRVASRVYSRKKVIPNGAVAAAGAAAAVLKSCVPIRKGSGHFLQELVGLNFDSHGAKSLLDPPPD